MGSWGFDSTENDAALDWLDRLHGETELADRLEVALEGDLIDDAEEIRCAASLIETLVRQNLWGGDRPGPIITLAVDRLQRLLDSGVIRQPGSVVSIRRQISGLAALLHEEVQTATPQCSYPTGPT